MSQPDLNNLGELAELQKKTNKLLKFWKGFENKLMIYN